MHGHKVCAPGGVETAAKYSEGLGAVGGVESRCGHCQRVPEVPLREPQIKVDAIIQLLPPINRWGLLATYK